jgi:hypothetical protein
MSDRKFDPTQPVQFRDAVLKNPVILAVGKARMLVGFEEADGTYAEGSWATNGSHLNCRVRSGFDLINVPEQAPLFECYVNKDDYYIIYDHRTLKSALDVVRDTGPHSAVHMREVYVPKNPTYKVYSFLAASGHSADMTRIRGTRDNLYWIVEEQTGIVISGPHKL